MQNSSDNKFVIALKSAVAAGLVALVLAIPIIGLPAVDIGGGTLGLEPRVLPVIIAAIAVFAGRFLLVLQHPLATKIKQLLIGLGILYVLLAYLNVHGESGEVVWQSYLWASESGVDYWKVAKSAIAFAIAILGGVLVRLYIQRIVDPNSDEPVFEQFARPFAEYSKPIGVIVVLLAVALPFMPFSDRYVVDVATLTLIYIMLGWGLNIVVGLAGLLDLGYVAFYAVGAYSYALLAIHFDFSFWICLPLAGAFAAFFGVILGFPVLRLRGDYLAIVTLGFGEMIRIVLINWYDVTKGPDGLSSIPRPTFFGLPFKRKPPEGIESFHQYFGMDYSSMHRLIFLYFLILLLALVTYWFSNRMRSLPVGRAWEALREDEIACRSLGINATNTKLTAFAVGAMFGGFAGSFFATRQGFISPESFVFIESAVILAIVVLGGMGSQFGVVIASIFLILMPEIFRQLEEFRMLAFGAGMVLIMVWRPQGLSIGRAPSIKLHGDTAAGGRS